MPHIVKVAYVVEVGAVACVLVATRELGGHNRVANGVGGVIDGQDEVIDEVE